METGEPFIILNDKGDEFSPLYNQWNIAGSESQEVLWEKRTNTPPTDIADGWVGVPSCAVFYS